MHTARRDLGTAPQGIPGSVGPLDGAAVNCSMRCPRSGLLLVVVMRPESHASAQALNPTPERLPAVGHLEGTIHRKPWNQPNALTLPDRTAPTQTFLVRCRVRIFSGSGHSFLSFGSTIVFPCSLMLSASSIGL